MWHALLLLLVLSALVSSVAYAHSWIECLDTDRSVVFDRAAAFLYGGPHAAGLCQGYQRGYRGRGANVRDDDLMVKILKDDYARENVRVCKPSQDGDEPPTGFNKRLRVAPGARAFFAYMPNGHVAVDKAARGTKWGLHWSRSREPLAFTSQLTDDTLLDGTRHDFDDGVCGQTYANRTTRELSGRAGDDFPCVGEFVVPPDTAPGVYPVVWMWKFWDELNDRREIETVGGKFGGAAYSSCFDVEVTDEGGATTAMDTYAPGTVMPAANAVDMESRQDTTNGPNETLTETPTWTP